MNGDLTARSLLLALSALVGLIVVWFFHRYGLAVPSLPVPSP